MKDTATLINVSRGPIVDEQALVSALEREEIAAAYLDVFKKEPPEQSHPLRSHPNVITTPHVAWYSEEANDERRAIAAENVRNVLTGDQPANIIIDPTDSEI